jgi:hypothetical protein
MVYWDEKPFIFVQSYQLLGRISFLQLQKMEVAGFSESFMFIHKMARCQAQNTEF